MPYALRYRPDTPLGRKFTQIALQTYERRTDAEHVLELCSTRDQLEVVEVDDEGLNTPVKQGETARIGTTSKDGRRASSGPVVSATGRSSAASPDATKERRTDA